jgi:hypothetical protein
VPTDEALHAASHKIVVRPKTRLSRRGALVGKQGSTYMADYGEDLDDGRAQVTAGSSN